MPLFALSGAGMQLLIRSGAGFAYRCTALQTDALPAVGLRQAEAEPDVVDFRRDDFVSLVSAHVDRYSIWVETGIPLDWLEYRVVL